MPSIEFMAEIEMLKARVKELTDDIATMQSEHVIAVEDLECKVYALHQYGDDMDTKAEIMEARAEKTEHMSGLWKQLAKRWNVSGWTLEQYDVLLYREQCKRKREAIARAEKAEAELTALKCCGSCQNWHSAFHHGVRFDCSVEGAPGGMSPGGISYAYGDPAHVCPEWKAREK